jgi:hypothetical protein
MEQSFLRSSSASQEIPRIFWNPKFIYCVCIAAACPLLSYINPVHATHSIYGISISILFSYPRLGLQSGIIPSGYPIMLHTPPI